MSNQRIISRTISGGQKGKPNDTQYYLLIKTSNGDIVYDDWYFPNELVVLSKCIISKNTLINRIRNDSELYPNLEACIFRKRISSSDMSHIQKQIKVRKRTSRNKNKAYLIKDEWFLLHNIMSIGSLHKEYRRMGSISKKKR